MKKLYEMRFWDKNRNLYWEIGYNGHYALGYNEAKRIAENECEHEYGNDWKKYIIFSLVQFNLDDLIQIYTRPNGEVDWEDLIDFLKEEKIVNLENTSLLDYIKKLFKK